MADLVPFSFQQYHISVSSTKPKSWLLHSGNNTTIKWISSASATVSPQSAPESTSRNPRAARKGNLHPLDWVTVSVATTRRHCVPVRLCVCGWARMCVSGWVGEQILINKTVVNKPEQQLQQCNQDRAQGHTQGHTDTLFLQATIFIYSISLPYKAA